MRIGEKDAAERIREKSGGLLAYVSGYETKESAIVVRCAICGEEFTRTYHHLTTHFRGCPVCVQKARELAREQIEADKKQRAEQKRIAKEEREAERERVRLERIHLCPVCGEITTRKVYCSPECSRKADNKRRDFNRRIKLMSAMVDKDITVEGLYRRDSGICYLCGGKCNYEDYTVRDGAFVVGDWYPSIDHVIPLSKGGLHSWDNVMLAHHRCNSEKSNNTISPYL